MTEAAPEKISAKYKIEIHFGKNRTMSGPNVCAVSAYESGKHLDGEGDEMMYICAERDRGLMVGGQVTKDKDAPIQKGKDGCGSFISGKQLKSGFAMCTSCNQIVKADALTNSMFYSLSNKQLASKIATWFRKLDSNCDIYVKYHPTDIRYIAMEQAHGLDKARMLRGLSIYPLANIIKDTTAGASLESRIAAFLSS
jgi:hypothetical protein